MAKHFRELKVWQTAFDLAVESCRLADKIEKMRGYAMANQIRSCAISVPSNIAEGFGRNTFPEFLQFLRYSNGSLQELQTLLMISQELGHLNSDDYFRYEKKIEEICKMNRSLSNSLRTKIESQTRTKH